MVGAPDPLIVRRGIDAVGRLSSAPGGPVRVGATIGKRRSGPWLPGPGGWLCARHFRGDLQTFTLLREDVEPPGEGARWSRSRPCPRPSCGDTDSAGAPLPPCDGASPFAGPLALGHEARGLRARPTALVLVTSPLFVGCGSNPTCADVNSLQQSWTGCVRTTRTTTPLSRSSTARGRLQLLIRLLSHLGDSGGRDGTQLCAMSEVRREHLQQPVDLAVVEYGARPTRRPPSSRGRAGGRARRRRGAGRRVDRAVARRRDTSRGVGPGRSQHGRRAGPARECSVTPRSPESPSSTRSAAGPRAPRARPSTREPLAAGVRAWPGARSAMKSTAAVVPAISS